MDPYNRIMKAAEKGNGVRLSADEVWQMHLDDAIATTATNISQGHDVRNLGQDEDGAAWPEF